MNDEVKKFLSKIGRKGGKKTVENHGKLQMKAWGKLGGYPKGRPRKPVDKLKNKKPILSTSQIPA